jgi:hypothetical protein
MKGKLPVHDIRHSYFLQVLFVFYYYTRVVNDERTGKCLRQVEDIRGHLWHRYFITVNQVMVATVKFNFKVMTSTLPKGTLGSVAALLAAFC